MVKIEEYIKQVQAQKKEQKPIKVKREDQNQELLEALEKDGFTLKFGDAGKYTDDSSNRVYRSYMSGYPKEEGQLPKCEYGQWRYEAKEVLIKATLRKLQPFKSKPIIIRSATLREEEVQVREEIYVEAYDEVNAYRIEYKDFKYTVTAEQLADNAHFRLLLEKMQEEGLSPRICLQIANKFLDRMEGEKPPMETKYYSYIRFYSKLFKKEKL